MWAGLPADVGLAAGAFVGTNLDNAVVATTMVAAAPDHRATRIATGQVLGFAVLIVVAVATSIALFEISTRVIGLLGLVPLLLGLRGLVALRHAEGRQRVARRGFGTGVTAAALVTVGAGGDNLAVYVPLFRAAGATGRITTAAVFLVGEVLLTLLILGAGRHPRTRAAVTRIGVVASPVLYCAIGVLVLFQAGTLSF
jgi:cadmium resistance protein CadD (predicted permease)